MFQRGLEPDYAAVGSLEQGAVGFAHRRAAAKGQDEVPFAGQHPFQRGRLFCAEDLLPFRAYDISGSDALFYVVVQIHELHSKTLCQGTPVAALAAHHKPGQHQYHIRTV